MSPPPWDRRSSIPLPRRTAEEESERSKAGSFGNSPMQIPVLPISYGNAQRPSRNTENDRPTLRLCNARSNLNLYSAHSVLLMTDLDDPCAAFSAPSTHDWMHAGAAHARNI
jgi:hypothetical protein